MFRKLVWWVCTSVHCTYVYSPLLTSAASQSGTGTEIDYGGNDAILSQKVYSELIILVSLNCENFSVKSLTFSVEHPHQLILFRNYVSRTSAGKGRAVLEGVGLKAARIQSCFKSNPLDEESSVQAGLIKWSGGKGHQPPTWKVLLDAMYYAEVAQQYIESLKRDLILEVC